MSSLRIESIPPRDAFANDILEGAAAIAAYTGKTSLLASG
jgi:hypothetical protein